ncbi:MAG: hypothetical protein MAG795_00614 [Candidatus Woesearchaeota archaeon]|nr:hypothetical protein [Candidatus Woesearchaeota archaeon]
MYIVVNGKIVNQYLFKKLDIQKSKPNLTPKK